MNTSGEEQQPSPSPVSAPTGGETPGAAPASPGALPAVPVAGVAAAAGAGAVATAAAKGPPPGLSRAGKFMWVLIAIFSGVYMVVPEPTDALIPFFGVGLIDEGMMFGLLIYSLERLGINIPGLTKLMRFMRGGRGKGAGAGAAE